MLPKKKIVSHQRNNKRNAIFVNDRFRGITYSEKKRMGSRIDLCGTPQVSGAGEDVSLLRLTGKVLLVK